MTALKMGETMAQAASSRPAETPPHEVLAALSRSSRPQLRAASRAAMVLVVAAGGAVAIAAAGGGAAARSWGQLATFVVVLLLLVPMAPGGVKVPSVLLVCSAVAALLGFALRLTALDISESSFIVAQLAEDKLQADAKILRNRMRSAVANESPVHVGTISRRVTRAEEAQEILRSDPSVFGVAWGTTRWTSVSLRALPPLWTSSLPQDSYARRALERRGIQPQQIIVSVPTIGLSDAKLPATGQFLGRLAQVWPRYSTALTNGVGADSIEFELRSMSAIKAGWTSNGHRALPMWMTGTLHLIRAISGPELEAGELQCALRAFDSARAQLLPGNNKELQVAILNNLAVATLYRGGVDLGSKQSQRQANAIFGRIVTKAREMGGPLREEVRVVAANLRASKGLPPKKERP